jgi:hypothetical protein
MTHTFVISKSFYVPAGNVHLISPQHWAQTQQDKSKGTGSETLMTESPFSGTVIRTNLPFHWKKMTTLPHYILHQDSKSSRPFVHRQALAPMTIITTQLSYPKLSLSPMTKMKMIQSTINCQKNPKKKIGVNR